MLPVTSASPPRDEPARTSSGKVRHVAKATDGQRQKSAEPTSPKRGHKTSGGKRKASSSESDTSKSLRDEIQEGFQNLGRDLRRLTLEVDKAGNRWPGKPPPGGLKQRTSRGDPRFWLIIFRVGPYVNTYACTAVLFHFWALWGDTPARTGFHHSHQSGGPLGGRLRLPKERLWGLEAEGHPWEQAYSSYIFGVWTTGRRTAPLKAGGQPWEQACFISFTCGAWTIGRPNTQGATPEGDGTDRGSEGPSQTQDS